MFRRMVWSACLLTAGAIGGWKLKDKWEDTVRPVRPASMVAKVSQACHGISRRFSSDDDEEKKEGGGDADHRRRVKELEEKFARQEEKKRDMQKLLARIAAVEDMRNGPSYQHEFPPLPPPATTRRP